jgi:hypothetical protein
MIMKMMPASANAVSAKCHSMSSMTGISTMSGTTSRNAPKSCPVRKFRICQTCWRFVMMRPVEVRSKYSIGNLSTLSRMYRLTARRFAW